jgi:hypothetical protein
VQPTERPRSPRPWWLLRRVSLDRDAQRVPAFSDMALQYCSRQQTQGFRAVRLGSIIAARSLPGRTLAAMSAKRPTADKADRPPLRPLTHRLPDSTPDRRIVWNLTFGMTG